MADLLCPSCGKPNPEKLEICQYCGTLLKNRGTEPLAPIHPGEAPTPKKTAELERTLPAWLRDIRKGSTSGSSAAEAAKEPTPAPAAPAPVKPPSSWPKAPVAKDESPLDFLAGLAKDNEDEEQVPDWLAGLKGNLPGGPVPLPEPPAIKPQPGAVVPGQQPGTVMPGQQPQEPDDWLAGLQGGSSFQPAAEQSPASSSEFDRGPVSFQEPEKPAAQTPQATPDWLNTLQAQQDSAKAPDQPATPDSPPAGDFPPIEGLPDWLSGLVGGPDVPVATPPAAPASFQPPVSPAATPPAGEAAAPALSPAPVPAETTPDWLSAASSAPPAPDSSVPAESPPDWLSAAPTGKLTLPEETAPAVTSPDGGDLPDWLSSLGNNAPVAASPSEPALPEAGSPAESVFPSAGTDVPDWLSAAMTEQAVQPPSPEDSGVSQAFSTGSLPELGTLGGTGGLPDWMAGLSLGGAAAHGLSASQAKPNRPSQPAGPAPDASGAGAFAWPAETTGGESGPVTGASQPLAEGRPVEEPAGATPGSNPPAGSEQNLDAILSMDMPDWLSGFAPTESEPPTQPASGAATGANISPADLPSWVQAMRPMESVITGAESGDDERNVEREGPLAGLRSVLPAQPEAFGIHKPKAYSIRLQVDAAQQAQATLLENLIASEAESQPVAIPRRVVTIRWLRWLIAGLFLVVLLIASLLPIDFMTSIFPVPVGAAEIGDFHSVIGNLPAGAPVLAVFDYQPGYAGEMQQAGGPAIDDLIGKNARLAFVSTSPVGSLMSENMMAQHALQNAEVPVDLGYLAGGAAGIQVFADNPVQTLGTAKIWQGLGVQNFSDFATVVVLTDNPDTGRQWIEQTSQVLQDQGAAMPPMLMVISAQAEPMIRPYYESGQIKGLVSGLAGGADYEAAIQRPGKAAMYWGSYSLGLIAAELLIMIGGVWAVVENLRARRTDGEPAEEDEA